MQASTKNPRPAGVVQTLALSISNRAQFEVGGYSSAIDRSYLYCFLWRGLVTLNLLVHRIIHDDQVNLKENKPFHSHVLCQQHRLGNIQ